MIYLFRMLALGILALVWLVLGLIVCICRPRHPNNVHILTKMLGTAQWVLGVKVTLRTCAEVKDYMPAILVGNHQSNWDIILMSPVVYPGTVCVGKKSLIWTPIFGILFYLSGNILVDRKNRKKTGDAFLAVVKKIREKSLSVWMFPEGHRSKGQGLLPFQSGAVHIAMLANVPIIPFVTSSYVGQIKLNRWNNGEIVIQMLPPIRFENMERSEIKKQTVNLRAQMLEAVQKLDKEVQRPEGCKLPEYK